MKKFFLCAGLFLLGATTAIQAENSYPYATFSGFGTFGYTGTDSQTLGYVRDLSQPTAIRDSWSPTLDSRLGLQGDVDFSGSLHATIQWIAREHEGNFFEQNLEWAFLRWTPSHDLTVRLGRVGADLFLLSDYRNVGYAQPWMTPPHDFYASFPIYHVDGIDATQKWQVANGTLALKIFGGYSFNQLPSFVSAIYDAKTTLNGINLNYEKGNWRSRLGYSYMRIFNDPPFQQLKETLNSPAINAILPGANQLDRYTAVKNSDLHFISLGATYDDGTWLAQTEGGYLHSPTRFLPSTFLSYLSLGRRVKAFTFYTLLGLSESFQDPVTMPQPLVNTTQIKALTDSTENLLNGRNKNEKSVSLGMRWDFYDKMAFKFEWNHYFIDQSGAGTWLKEKNLATSEEVNVWSLGIDFVF